MERIDRELGTTLPVLTEAFYLLGQTSVGAQRLMDFVIRGGLSALALDDTALARAFELMVQYADLPMDFADASLVAVAEANDLRSVFTIDRRDFDVYRIRRGHQHFAFDVIA